MLITSRKSTLVPMITVAVLFTLLLPGCGTYHKTVHVTVRPESAVLTTEGIRIEGVGKYADFEMKTMEPVVPPVIYDVVVINEYSEYDDSFVRRMWGGGITPKQAADYANTFKGKSAFDVRIHVEGRDEPLYGRMLFFTVFAASPESLPKRQWRVTIPSQYLRGAEGGIVQTVFQPYTFNNNEEYVSWMLAMSSLPF